MFFLRLRCTHLVAASSITLMASMACSAPLAPAGPQQLVTIGVQVVQGRVQEMEDWQRWVAQWAPSVPHLQVELRPLRWDALQQAVQQGQLQFAVTSPGHFVALEVEHGAVRLASERPVQGSADAAHAVGSAVVVPASSAIHNLRDLQGHAVAAVDARAFGGYQIMAAQWKKLGMDAARDLRMHFTDYPMERSLQAVQQGHAQAAILRVCMWEQMVARGQLPASEWRVLPPADGVQAESAVCQASSPLYPGWALSTLPHTPANVAHDVLVAVLTHTDAQGASRWTVPADYQSVHEVLRTLQVPPYAPAVPTLQAWLWQHRYWGFAACMLVLIGIAYLVHVEALVKRRTQALVRSQQEREALAQQMAQVREKMEHMGRLSVLGELSATLAHEISHPLASLSNYVGGLRRRHGEGRLQAEQLTSALYAMEQALTRTQGVLDSVRALARKRVSLQQQAALWPLVCETVGLFRTISATAAQSIPIELACPEDLQRAQVLMDALQIQQVLLNLLKNAQDLHRAENRLHMPVWVSLSWGQNVDTVVLAVCDQGPSMSEQSLAQLFEPFFTTKPDGLGLGLSISRNIAELHGGHLQARAQEHASGLCMELVLPLARAVQATENMNEIGL